MTDLRVNLLQYDIIWQDRAANIALIDGYLLDLAPNETDLIVLPEMFTTGFTMNAAANAEPWENSITRAWLAVTAKRLNAAVVGSFIVEVGGKYYNRLVFMRPDGHCDTYDKRHLFAMAGEHEVFTAGIEKLLVMWRGWRLMPLICYDLRFPVWSRNTLDYDVLIYIANWPARRGAHWQNLLVARAIENQCFTLAVNRVGVDGNGLTYSGDSAVINANGDKIADANEAATLVHAVLSRRELDDFRNRLPFLKDRD